MMIIIIITIIKWHDWITKQISIYRNLTIDPLILLCKIKFFLEITNEKFQQIKFCKRRWKLKWMWNVVSTKMRKSAKKKLIGSGFRIFSLWMDFSYSFFLIRFWFISRFFVVFCFEMLYMVSVSELLSK